MPWRSRSRVWKLNGTDVDAILGGAGAHRLHEPLVQRGHRFMLDDFWAKAEAGETSLDEIGALA